MIKYIKGDLLTSKVDVIVHGCNCFQTMGSGVALAIRNVYPEAYEADCAFGEKGNPNKLGMYSAWRGAHKLHKNRDLTIVNLYTQFTYNPSTIPFSYDAFIVGFRRVLNNFQGESIAMPKIGSGLAGGNWEIIESIINILSKDRKIRIYVL
jgi:O-acetyl-ADP-ribose deacetylase (regulator of RNase III)